MEKIRQMFILQDYAKDLLFNSDTKEQETESRKFLDKIDEELKELYIPIATENV